MRRLVFIVLYFLLRQTADCQGTIVVRIGEDVIFVGADSRNIETKVNPQTGRFDTSFSTICKVYHINNFDFAVTGGFLQASIVAASKACNNNSLFRNVIIEYGNEILKKLKDTLQQLRIGSKEAFERIYQSGSITKIVFLGFDGRKPQITMFNFFIKHYTEEKIDIGIRTSTYNRNNIWLIGNYQNIRYQAFLVTTWQDGPAKAITDLIAIEAKASDQQVATPVDVLQIRPNEVKWLQKRESCE